MLFRYLLAQADAFSTSQYAHSQAREAGGSPAPDAVLSSDCRSGCHGPGIAAVADSQIESLPAQSSAADGKWSNEGPVRENSPRAGLVSASLRMHATVSTVCGRSHLVHSLVGGVVRPQTGICHWCIVFVVDATGGIQVTVTATGNPLDGSRASDGFHCVRRRILPTTSTTGNVAVADSGLQFQLRSIFEGLEVLGFSGVKDDVATIELMYASEAYMARRDSFPSAVPAVRVQLDALM